MHVHNQNEMPGSEADPLFSSPVMPTSRRLSPQSSRQAPDIEFRCLQPDGFDKHTGQSRVSEIRQQPFSSRVVAFEKLTPFLVLIPTTSISVLLLIGNAKRWEFSGRLHGVIESNRAITQVAVQAVFSILGLLHLFVVGKLLQWMLRLHLATRPMSLEALQFWTSILAQQWRPKLRSRFLIPLAIFTLACLGPAALRVGALTPVAGTASLEASLQLPSYVDTEILTYKWSERFGLESKRTPRDFFTYNVGELNTGKIIETAASATTVDGSPRRHAKMDNTGYLYNGRSYGVGVSVGLVDDDFVRNQYVTNYTFKEPGYTAISTCIHNLTTDYRLESNPGSYFPGPLSEVYLTVGPFTPTLFDILVDPVGKTIDVTPLNDADVTDIEPKGNLTFLANWKYTLIASDQTNLYSSLLGRAMYTNIENYKLLQASAGHEAASEKVAALRALEDSFDASMDDIFSGYAAAQLMVANVTQETRALVLKQGLRIEQRAWILTVLILNLILAFAAGEETFRTRCWKDLDEFDFTDLRDVIVGTIAGSVADASATGAELHSSVSRSEHVTGLGAGLDIQRR
ncbi:hypothetical protein CSOJ01_15669 [Colletotrichum sojae]|uniref:Uncharacterized protein n=1 Tax=Colletotrichum sojae TaxID=2175907 RepID=A0A8H6ILX6_9PEZI|nr:hypothetical protein CSOJ01_15669 [Colletotrichum sojae]